MRNIDELHRIAQPRLGIVTTQQLRDMGISAGVQQRLEGAGYLSRIHPGVLRITGYTEDYRQLVQAALAYAGPDSMASHRTAAILLGAPLIPHTWVELIVPRGSTARHSGIVAHQPTNRMDIRPQTVDGMAVCNPLRVLLDLGASASPAEVAVTLEHFLISGAVTITSVRAARERHRSPGRTGLSTIDSVLEEYRFGIKPPDSVLELAFDRIVERYGLPRPVFHHPIRIGSFTFTPDFFWPEFRFIVEVDGWAYHSGRKQTEEDRQRDLLLAGAGYTVLRLTWQQIVRRPALVAGNLCLSFNHRSITLAA